MIEPMKPKVTLQQAEIQDGDIVCFQRVLSEKEYIEHCLSANFFVETNFLPGLCSLPNLAATLMLESFMTIF